MKLSRLGRRKGRKIRIRIAGTENSTFYTDRNEEATGEEKKKKRTQEERAREGDASQGSATLVRESWP